MKEAIITMCIGQNPNMSTIRSMKKYAAKYKKDFYAIISPKLFCHNTYFEKYQYLELFEQGYDRILFLDSDVLITPQAQNIFECYKHPEKFYAFDENFQDEWMNREKWIDQMPVDFHWPINWRGMRKYFNAGVQLASKHNEFIHHITTTTFRSNNFTIDPSDQTALNFLCFKYAPKQFETIDYSFNRMDLGQTDETNIRYRANFIHYAGPCKYGNGNKLETIEKDYLNIYDY